MTFHKDYRISEAKVTDKDSSGILRQGNSALNSDSSYMEEKEPFSLVLVGVDISSEQTPRIIQVASRFSKAFDAKVIVCNVVQMSTSTQGNETDGSPVNDEERRTLSLLRKMAHDAFGMEAEDMVDVKILHGDSAERIAEYAEYSNCDLIMVGSHGHGQLKRALLGSVSSSVAARAKRSLLIVRGGSGQGRQ